MLKGFSVKLSKLFVIVVFDFSKKKIVIAFVHLKVYIWSQTITTKKTTIALESLLENKK